jgi:hypothetical protein
MPKTKAHLNLKWNNKTEETANDLYLSSNFIHNWSVTIQILLEWL